MARARATRGRPSRIEQLPPEIKAALDALLRSGVSQREVLRRLNPEVTATGEAPLSRSGLNRYTTDIASQLAEAGQEVRQTRAAAAAFVAKLGEQPTGEVGQLAVEVLRTMAVRTIVRARQMGQDEDIDIKDLSDLINSLALSLQRLESAAGTAARREREAAAAVAKKVGEVAARRGLGDDTVADLTTALTTS